MSFESTKWTSNSPAPFAPAPGAGYEGVRPASTNYESGFAVSPAYEDWSLSDENVKVARWAFKVRKKRVLQGQVPSALVQIYLTDRGAFTQPQLDVSFFTPIRNTGFLMNVGGSKLESLPVTWGWKREPAADKYTRDLYYPVVVSPSSLAGMKYAGNAISNAEMMDLSFSPNDAQLARLPKQLWVYSFAVTDPNKQMTNADAAQLLTLLKAGWISSFPQADAYGYGYVTFVGAKPSVFDGPVPPPPLPPFPPPPPPPSPIPTPEPISTTKSNFLLLVLAAAAAFYTWG